MRLMTVGVLLFLWALIWAMLNAAGKEPPKPR